LYRVVAGIVQGRYAILYTGNSGSGQLKKSAC